MSPKGALLARVRFLIVQSLSMTDCACKMRCSYYNKHIPFRQPARSASGLSDQAPLRGVLFSVRLFPGTSGFLEDRVKAARGGGRSLLSYRSSLQTDSHHHLVTTCIMGGTRPPSWCFPAIFLLFCTILKLF